MGKRLGQHFLGSTSIAQRIVQFAKVEDRTVLEIGPGRGILTHILARYAKRVFAVEIDSRLAEKLKQENIPNVTILNQNFLKTDLSQFQNCIIVGNIPYYITTSILNKLVVERQYFERAILTVQREYGERLTARTGAPSYGSITLYINYYFEVNKGFLIPARFFSPRPRVSAMVISLKRRIISSPHHNEDAFFKFIQGIFRYRRKLLKNCLKFYLGFTLESLAESIARRRPAELNLKDFEYLYDLIYKDKPQIPAQR